MSTDASLRTVIGPHIPFLRRYGRALTGSQAAGDAMVRTALESLVSNAGDFDSDNNPRVALFRLFHTAQSATDDLSGLSDRRGVGEGLVLQLVRPRREALLLTAVEGFSVEEAAEILSRSPHDVKADLDAARAAITAELAANVLIIEDEPVIAMHLQDIVEDMGHHVVGIASTRNEAARLGTILKPDLVLADIRLADGSSGIDAVNDILVDQDMPVIFITAFPERLLTGERPEPTYLITKPFEVETVVVTIGQALLMQRDVAA